VQIRGAWLKHQLVQFLSHTILPSGEVWFPEN
jgi:hypothetical protein